MRRVYFRSGVLKLSIHQNPLESLLKQMARPHLQSFWFSKFGVGPKVCISGKGQVVLMLLVRRPHFENHGSSGLSSMWCSQMSVWSTWTIICYKAYFWCTYWKAWRIWLDPKGWEIGVHILTLKLQQVIERELPIHVIIYSCSCSLCLGLCLGILPGLQDELSLSTYSQIEFDVFFQRVVIPSLYLPHWFVI